MRYSFSSVTFTVLCVAVIAPQYSQGQPRESAVSKTKWTQLQATAEELSRQPRLVQAVDQACLDKKVHATALADATTLLKTARVSLPKDVSFETFEPEKGKLFEPPPRGTIVLTHCRAIWVCPKGEEPKPCKPNEERLCLGFRIIPRIVPPGPVPPVAPSAPN